MTLVAGTNRKMDKSTVLQATISFLKRNKEMSSQHCQQEEVTETLKPKYISNAEFSPVIQINIMLSNILYQYIDIGKIICISILVFIQLDYQCNIDNIEIFMAMYYLYIDHAIYCKFRTIYCRG